MAIKSPSLFHSLIFFCLKKFFPQLSNTAGLSGKFSYSLSNKIFPAALEDSLTSIVEKYFTPLKENISEQEKVAPSRGKVEVRSSRSKALKEELEDTEQLDRAGLKEALLLAIQSEIDRYLFQITTFTWPG